MDDATLTSSTDVGMMDRHILEQLLMIRPLLRKEGSDAAAADDGGDAARGDVVKEIVKECMALSKDQSKDLLLAVLLDVLLLHLLDGEEEGRVEVPTSAASDQQLMSAAAAKKKAAAAAKKKRNKRNKAAAKQKHKRGTKFMAWLGGGMIPRIMMVVVGSITTLIFALSLIHQSDGSSEGNAPPTLPPSTITSLRQRRDLQSSSMPSTPPNTNIMSPSPIPVGAQAPTPTFSPTAIERNALTDFYYSTGGPEWTDRGNWLDGFTSYCDWKGVTCDEDMNHVIKLHLHNNGLSGTLSESIGNLTFIEELDLSDNYIKGSIPAEIGKNLNVLTRFDVSGNQLSGEVEALVALSLTYADFSNNNFTSMRRFEKYKGSFETLRYCDASNNSIQEDATELLENISPNIEQFIASNNQIYGNLPESLNNLQKLRRFNMSSNALSGELPGFTESFVTLQELDMSNQTHGFTGPIPENVWRSPSLKMLNLADNRLTGTIPSLVGNLAVLEVFDVSNNRLDSSIPAELGMLEGSLKRLDLSNNTFSGVIPYQIGQLQGASVFLKDNHFYNSTVPAPLSLCLKREVKEFDLANDTALCPIERSALSDFYDSAGGPEWTIYWNWLDESTSYCHWFGVTCDKDMKHVIEVNLSYNGLSGRLSESIGNLTFIEVLDLSDNGIEGSIPSEIGKLSNLTYLRLSYNAFTGAPESLGELKVLQLLQLQSNRITEMPNIPRLNDSLYYYSTFVADCGVPSAFLHVLECKHCTMCCNANDDCYPQEKTQVAKWGLNYGTFAAICFACFIAFCCIVFRFLYKNDMRKNRRNPLPPEMEARLEEDDKNALSKICNDSVYSYFVTDNVFGWLVALVTLGIQVSVLSFFTMASDTYLQGVEEFDSLYTWKCPRDNVWCTNTAEVTVFGWVVFCLLMTAFLAKDMIGGCKLIYHSAKISHSSSSRIRYFFGGVCLCSITLFAVYASAVYSDIISKNTAELIVNSVIILFVMELDEKVFSTVTAYNEIWNAQAAESEGTSSDTKASNGSKLGEMNEEIARHEDQIAAQQEEIVLQKEQVASQNDKIAMLREAVQKLQESQVPQCVPANESMAMHAAESEDTSLDPDVGKGDTMDEMWDENALSSDE